MPRRVREVIEELQRHDPDALVFVDCGTRVKPVQRVTAKHVMEMGEGRRKWWHILVGRPNAVVIGADGD